MAAVTSLDHLLAARTLWHAGRSARQAADGEPTGHAALDALLPQGGWPRRALTELLLPADGVGELALLMPTLARCTRAGERVAVIAPPYVPYAPAWQAAGVDLAQLRIIDASPRDALWAFEQCLRSGACAAVLGWPQQADARALRRLQVAADSGQCLGFALRDRRHLANPSPAALRLEAVREARGMAWQVRKCRGGPVPAVSFVAESSQDPSHLAESAPVRRVTNAPSPACGGGLGWGPPSRDATTRASGAPPSAFGTFPRERGKDKPWPGIGQDPSHGTIEVPSHRTANAPSPANSGGGPGWGQADRDSATRASGAPPSAFGTFPREWGKGRAVHGTTDPSHLASDVSARRIVNAPSPVNSGGGPGWGQADRDSATRASGAPPPPLGAFPPGRGGGGGGAEGDTPD